VTMGRIVGVFGVKGWLKVASYTEPPSNLFSYRDWRLDNAPMTRASVEQHRQHGQVWVVKFNGVDDRDQAALMVGAEIQLLRNQLPEPATNEYYWVDLEGLEAFTVDGTRLGVVSHLFATGANDVLVIHGERERMVPYVWDRFVKQVDLANQRIVVDWDASF